MKIDVYSNGKLLYSITGTEDFDPGDIAVVSRKMIEQATISMEGFESLVKTEMVSSKTMKEAYEKAENKHSGMFGHTKYCDYNSYRITSYKYEKMKK